jgi:hydroxypyruvate isomerase
MKRTPQPTRRSALQALGAGVAGALAVTHLPAVHSAEPAKPKGRLKQSICRWCYGGIKLEELAVKGKAIGYQSIELITPEEYKVIKPLGLTCAVLRCATGIVDGLNRKENHDRIEKALLEDIEFAAAEGLRNVLCMSGNRRGMADDEGLANCAAGLKRVMKRAEARKVTVLMEGLNSKVDHKDYMYDHTAWGLALCKKVGSPRFKLLYDIYHMQIMDGDVIRTIRQNKEHMGHFHTGGNPGRNEIDETQELNYAAIARAIVGMGFDGYLSQEFIPKRDPFASLAQAFRICDV